MGPGFPRGQDWAAPPFAEAWKLRTPPHSISTSGLGMLFGFFILHCSRCLPLAVPFVQFGQRLFYPLLLLLPLLISLDPFELLRQHLGLQRTQLRGPLAGMLGHLLVPQIPLTCQVATDVVLRVPVPKPRRGQFCLWCLTLLPLVGQQRGEVCSLVLIHGPHSTPMGLNDLAGLRVTPVEGDVQAAAVPVISLRCQPDTRPLRYPAEYVCIHEGLRCDGLVWV
mmetsp:Transcript_41577/g.74596  ORF Transcript_41577/g.74596 Transcript_41577/m.74596 type:complete len:223 (-) Transcript_41577:394-1062(-)